MSTTTTTASITTAPSESSSSSKRKLDSEPPTKKKSKIEGQLFLDAVWSTELPEDSYDEDGAIKIYDNCNDVRRKINKFMKESSERGITQTALLRLLSVNSNSYQRFMKLSGPAAGAENNAYRGFYEFFEKLRVYEKKPKTAARKKAEEEFPGGHERYDQSKMGCWVPFGMPAPSIADIMRGRAGTK
eukprot:TRINITY_DN7012_c0_g1_i1.p1 TRINITY_DN7012_c0_g1~~TRINITY_DN7012_c0_g1_i1.p1  ORF type:complete len:206 (-),score=44.25 TRINITY_DN7012_c0_g1_i1:143-703(-)